MQLEKGIVGKIVWGLLFLFSLNLFNQSSLILMLLFGFIVIMDKGKIYYCSKDSMFYLLIIFAVTFFLFAAQNGISTGISAFGCPMSYYIGKRMITKQNELQIKSIAILLVTGMTCHAFVNFFYELIRFGGINSSGTHYDFFSLGAVTSATGAATYLTLFAGVIFYIILESDSLKKWIIGLIMIVIAFAYDMILGGRSFFALTAAAFVISMIIYVLYQETTKEKLVAFRKMLLVFIVLFVVGMIVYTVYKEEITNIFESTYLFHRISYANIAESQDLFSFFKTTDRGDVRNQYIKLMWDYPFGGRKILAKVGVYAHELWLDIFDSAGIVPYILMWVISIQITVNNIQYVLCRQTTLKNRVLIVGITVAVTVQFFFEPILTGCRALLFSYFLICGMVKRQMKFFKEEV